MQMNILAAFTNLSARLSAEPTLADGSQLGTHVVAGASYVQLE